MTTLFLDPSPSVYRFTWCCTPHRRPSLNRQVPAWAVGHVDPHVHAARMDQANEEIAKLYHPLPRTLTLVSLLSLIAALVYTTFFITISEFFTIVFGASIFLILLIHTIHTILVYSKVTTTLAELQDEWSRGGVVYRFTNLWSLSVVRYGIILSLFRADTRREPTFNHVISPYSPSPPPYNLA